MAALKASRSALSFSASPVSLGSLGLAGAGGGVTRAYSTVNEPLSRPSFSRMRSAVSMELWRKPVVVVTTRTFLGLDAPEQARVKARSIVMTGQSLGAKVERFMGLVDNGSIGARQPGTEWAASDGNSLPRSGS